MPDSFQKEKSNQPNMKLHLTVLRLFSFLLLATALEVGHQDKQVGVDRSAQIGALVIKSYESGFKGTVA